MLLELAAAELKLTINFLNGIVYSADHLYRTYNIPKKSGGSRQIEHPARRLKLLQRWLVRRYILKFPVHSAAMAYRPGLSIKDNALIHVQNRYMMRIDLKNFFHSLTGSDVGRLIAENPLVFEQLLSVSDSRIFQRIVTRSGRLTIGAPSSPALSNALMYNFDVHWSRVAQCHNALYSRYADDIVFSSNFPGILQLISEKFFNTTVHPVGLNLIPNREKTIFTSKKHRRSVTGLIISSENAVSIGRERKREIRTLVFRGIQGSLSTEEIARLQGLIAYVSSVEPEFIVRLERKFNASFRGRWCFASANTGLGKS